MFACDSFDAIMTDRPYARGKGLDEALAEMRRCAGTQFDPDVVAALCAVLEREGERSASHVASATLHHALPRAAAQLAGAA